MAESTSIEIQQEADASKINENENTEHTQCRIYKVPFHLREQNEKAYTPQVISIGPIHHNKEKFKTMEKHKERYFKSFMQRNVVVDEINLKNFVKDRMEDRIRPCYIETTETVPLDQSDGSVKMIILDAIFILELFLRRYLRIREIDDPMKVGEWLFHMVWHDLLLLENQLPFFVIDEIYGRALPSCSNSTPLILLTSKFFKSLNIHKKSLVKIQHFTDLLRFFKLPPANELPERGKEVTFPMYSITQLHEAGVKFEVISSKCIRDKEASSVQDEEASCVRDEEASSKRILDLSFKNGVLEIPLLEFQDTTESLVRNIMALEQCDYGRPNSITDFYLILDRLINTAKDVDLLSDKGIVVNSLGNSEAVTSMINNLNRGILRGDMNSKFNRLCKDLNKYYEKPWHKWQAILRHQYFSTPWRMASVIAAIILLVLTLIQTVCSILQVV
ncbi:UPF0481 protein At3g47200-like [Fagus crenata]